MAFHLFPQNYLKDQDTYAQQVEKHKLNLSKITEFIPAGQDSGSYLSLPPTHTQKECGITLQCQRFKSVKSKSMKRTRKGDIKMAPPNEIQYSRPDRECVFSSKTPSVQRHYVQRHSILALLRICHLDMCPGNLLNARLSNRKGRKSGHMLSRQHSAVISNLPPTCFTEST